MGKPEDLPDGYSDKFDYKIPSEDDVMREANKIPSIARDTILLDVRIKFENHDYPDQDKYADHEDIAYQRWKEAHQDEILEELKSWIPDSFRKFLTPVPSEFDPLIKELKSLRRKFGIDDDELIDTDFADIINAKDKLLEWEGTLPTARRIT